MKFLLGGGTVTPSRLRCGGLPSLLPCARLFRCLQGLRGPWRLLLLSLCSLLSLPGCTTLPSVLKRDPLPEIPDRLMEPPHKPVLLTPRLSLPSMEKTQTSAEPTGKSSPAGKP